KKAPRALKQGRPEIIVVFNRLIRDAAVIGFTRLKWVAGKSLSEFDKYARLHRLARRDKMRADIDFISNHESRISDQHMSKQISRKISILVLALLAFAATAIAQAPAPVFKAGAARRDVTPREPVPMWGYGDRHDALSVGTLDPLYAEALVIQAGDRKLA